MKIITVFDAWHQFTIECVLSFPVRLGHALIMTDLSTCILHVSSLPWITGLFC